MCVCVCARARLYIFKKINSDSNLTKINGHLAYKGKAVTVQAMIVVEGCRRLRFPGFSDST